MRFYTGQHRYYCGIDLHARTMYLCILEHDSGKTLLHRNVRCEPERVLRAIEPYRDDLVVSAECIFCWYWLADLCAQEDIPFVLGHALYMKAIHGGKAKNDRIDAHKIAVLLRGGAFPVAYVYPRGMRATRDLLRRRLFFVRRRSELFSHIRIVFHQLNLPATHGPTPLRGEPLRSRGSRTWGYAPLIVPVANTKEVLHVVNRSGNVPSHTDAAHWIDRAIEDVLPYAERVCVRGDTDFSLTKNFDGWAETVDFLFGMDANAALCSRAEALADSAWQRLERGPGFPSYERLTDQTRQRFQADEKARIVRERGYVNLQLNYEDVAEFTYKPGKCRRFYRVVALRKNISKMKGENTLLDEIRYFFYITTRTDLSTDDVVRCANERCDQESVIEQLKNGVNALRVPLYDLVSNWAYMVIAALAWNIKSWFAMMMHLKRERATYVAMEFPRFVHSMILMPCHVMARARGITLRLIGYQPTQDRFFSTWLTIHRTSFG